MGARVGASPPPSGAGPALVVATPAAERLRCPGGVARNARRSTVTEDQVPASFQLFDKEDVGGWRPAALARLGPQHIESFVFVVQIIDASVPQMKVCVEDPILQRIREQVPYDPADVTKFSSPDNIPSRCSLPSPQMMQELVKVLVVELVLRMEDLLTRRIQQRSAEQFSDPQVHIGGETCGSRQNLHSRESSSTILVGGGTSGVPPSSFPRLISSATSPAPVQNSVQCVDFPVLGATGTRGDSQGVLRGQGFP